MIGGWEDLKDAQTLRHDPVHQIAADSATELASAPTSCRFRSKPARTAAWAVNAELVEQFIASPKRAPAVQIFDFDATDTPVHGNQENRFFHGDHDSHCCRPL